MRHLTEVGEPIWLEIARKDIGLREVPGPMSNPRIEAMHGYTKAGPAKDDVAWCSSALCSWFEKAGIRSTRSKAAASWATWGQWSPLQPGAVVLFGKSDPDAKGTGHVALCVGVEGDQVLVLGGNQNNGVNIAKRPLSRVVAVRWPLV